MENGTLSTKTELPIKMKLYATPLSHFSRKVRILLDLYNANYEFIDIGNVSQTDLKVFNNNPLLRVPILMDEKNWIIEADHIAKYIVDKFDPTDRFRVNTCHFHELNIRAIMNGIMSEEVKLIIARRTGLPTENYPFFDKTMQVIMNGLDWLEAEFAQFNEITPGYLEFHLVCLWQHLDYYKLLPLAHPHLKKVVLSVLKNQRIAATSPFELKPL